MSDIDDELRQILHRIGAQAKPADLVQRSLSTARQVRRRRAGVAIGAAAVVVATLSIGGWSVASRNHADGGLLPATSPTASGVIPSAASPTSASPSASSASAVPVAPLASSPAAAAVSLQILVSPELSTPGQDATDLLPTSCTFTQTQRGGAGVVTAKGAFAGYYQEYGRYGDVVELYVFTGTPKTAPTTAEVAEIPNPSEPPLSTGSWQVSAPIVAPPSQSLFCLVAVQSTHAFIGAQSG